MGKHMNVPKLRFPEFEGEWVLKKLGEIATFINGKAYKQEELLDSGKYPVLRVGNFFSNSNWYYSDLELEDDKYCDNGDLLYAWSASFGPKIWDGNKTIYHYHIWKVLCSNKVQLKYLFYVLDEQTSKIKTSSSNGFALLHITKGTIEDWAVSIPILSEQTKITSFLTAVDDKLTQLKKKKSLLEEYKKGVMQKIFSQELRFKDDNGEDFPEWEEKTLGEILIEHKTRNKNNHVQEVFSVAKNKGVINQIEHLGRSYASQDVSNYKVVLPNDVIYTKSPTSDFPFGIIKQNKLERTGIVSVLYGVFTPINKNVGLLLDYYFSEWRNTYNYLNPLVQKGAKNTMNISNDDFLNGAELSLPSSDKEQTKIANFLSAIDEKINHCSKQIERIEEWKKGLLQQMFC